MELFTISNGVGVGGTPSHRPMTHVHMKFANYWQIVKRKQLMNCVYDIHKRLIDLLAQHSW